MPSKCDQNRLLTSSYMQIYVQVDGLSNKLTEYAKWKVCYMIDIWFGDVTKNFYELIGGQILSTSKWCVEKTV